MLRGISNETKIGTLFIIFEERHTIDAPFSNPCFLGDTEVNCASEMCKY